MQKQNKSVVSDRDPRSDIREIEAEVKELHDSPPSGGTTATLPSRPVALGDSRPQPQMAASVLASATIAECSLEHMLSLESVLSRGELAADSKRGTFLYVSAVSPRYLESSSPSRITYISALFRQWRGSIRLRLYVTKAIFQQTKLLLVFIPGAIPSEIRSMSLDALMGAECKTVMNPSNDEVAVLDVPFIHTANWQSVGGSTGSVALVLLERIVITQQTNSTIPWILTCCSPRGQQQLRFRYGVAPPSSGVPGGGDGGGSDNSDSGVSAASYIGESYAISSSARRRRRLVNGRADTSTVLDAQPPLTGAPGRLLVGVAVNWASCPSTQRLAAKLARLPLSPPFSFTFDAPTTQKTLVPYLPVINWLQGPLPNNQRDYPQSYDWYITSSNNKIEKDAVYFGQVPAAMSFTIGIADYPGLASEFDGWLVDLVIYTPNTGRGVNMIVFRVKSIESGKQLLLEYDHAVGDLTGGGIGAFVGYPMTWVDDPRNYARGPQIGAFLERQVTRARELAVAPYFMLWVGGGHPTAEAIRDWLYTDTDSTQPPKLAQGSLVALSLSQSPGLFDMVSETAERGIFTWIFSLFSNNTDSALYKIARVADCIFEFALPLLISYDGTPALVHTDTVTLRFLEATPGAERLRSDGARVVDSFPDLSPLEFGLESIPEAEEVSQHQALSFKQLFRRAVAGAQADPTNERKPSRRRRRRRGTRSEVSSRASTP